MHTTDNNNFVVNRTNNSNNRPGSKTLPPGQTGIPGHLTTDEVIKKSLPLIYIEFDIKGKILNMSDVAKNYLTEGRDISCLDDLNSADATNQWLEALKQQQSYDISKIEIRAAGKSYWLTGMFQVISKFKMPECGIIILHDITEQHLLEEKLKSLETKLSSSSEKEDGLVRILFDSHEKIEFVSSELATFFGYSTEELIGEKLDIILGSTNDYRRKTASDSSSGEFILWEFQGKDSKKTKLLSRLVMDETTRRFFIDVDLFGKITNQVDMRIIDANTDKKKVQKYLEALSKTTMFCMTNTKGEIVKFSVPLAELFECDAKDMLGKSFQEYFLDNLEYQKYLKRYAESNTKEESILMSVNKLARSVVFQTFEFTTSLKLHIFLLQKNEFLDSVKLARKNEELKQELERAKNYIGQLDPIDIVDPDSDRLKLKEMEIEKLQEELSAFKDDNVELELRLTEKETKSKKGVFALEERLSLAQKKITELETDAAVGGADEKERQDLVKAHEIATKAMSKNLDKARAENADLKASLQLAEMSSSTEFKLRQELEERLEEVSIVLKAKENILGSSQFEQDQAIFKLESRIKELDLIIKEQKDLIFAQREEIDQVENDLEATLDRLMVKEIVEHELEEAFSRIEILSFELKKLKNINLSLEYEKQELKSKKKRAERNIKDLKYWEKSDKDLIESLEVVSDEGLCVSQMMAQKYLEFEEEKKDLQLENQELKESNKNLQSGIEVMAKEIDSLESKVLDDSEKLPLENSLAVVEKFAEVLVSELDDASKIQRLLYLTEFLGKIAEIKSAIPVELEVCSSSLAIRNKEENKLPEDIELFTGRFREGLDKIHVNMNLVHFTELFDIIFQNAEEALLEKGDEGEMKFSVRKLSEGEKDLIRFRISDTGNGMSEEDLSQVTDRFFTNKAGHRGLGLTVAKYIVEESGGRMEIRSQLGHGTSVSVYLPVSEIFEAEIETAFENSGLLKIEDGEAQVIEAPGAEKEEDRTKTSDVFVEITRYKIRDNWKGRGRKVFIRQNNKFVLEIFRRAGYKITQNSKEARLRVFDSEGVIEHVGELKLGKSPILFLSYTEDDYRNARYQDFLEENIFKMKSLEKFDDYAQLDAFLAQVAHLSKMKTNFSM